MTKRSYISDVFDSRLSRTQRANIYTLFEDPWNIEQCANALKNVARKEGKEVHRNVRADERRFGRRMATPECRHLEIEEARFGRRSVQYVQSLFAGGMGHTPRIQNMPKTEIKESVPQGTST